MASVLEEELSCPVCQDIFRDPVLLSCSHSFCDSCLRRWWTQRRQRKCPICKRVSARTAPTRNLVLKNTCEAFLLAREREAVDLCGVHSEKLRLFCVDHQQLVCLVCRDSETHENHRFRPVDEVAQDHREELQKSLAPLEVKLKLFQHLKGNFNLTAEHIQRQARRTENRIRDMFEEMHQLLHREEETRVTALREEEEQKSRAVKEKTELLNRNVASLSATIESTKKFLSSDVSVLQNYETAQRRLWSCHLLECPRSESGALIDEAKHLGNLESNTWKRLEETVSFTPVVLDPNTTKLELCRHLSSVWLNDRRLPEVPERFDCPYVVLGSEGFTAGTHSWVIQVGASPVWFVGVAAETFRRKGSVDLRQGLWAVQFVCGKYTMLSHLKSSDVHPETKLQKLGVHLDLEKGQLSFYDVSTRKCFSSISHRWTEKIFPILYTESNLPLTVLSETLDISEDRRDVPDCLTCPLDRHLEERMTFNLQRFCDTLKKPVKQE